MMEIFAITLFGYLIWWPLTVGALIGLFIWSILGDRAWVSTIFALVAGVIAWKIWAPTIPMALGAVTAYLVAGGIYIVISYTVKAIMCRTEMREAGYSIAGYNARAEVHNAKIAEIEKPIQDLPTEERVELQRSQNAVEDYLSKIKSFFRARNIPLAASRQIGAKHENRPWFAEENIRLDMAALDRGEIAYDYLFWPIDLLHDTINDYLKKLIDLPLSLAKRTLATSINWVLR